MPSPPDLSCLAKTASTVGLGGLYAPGRQGTWREALSTTILNGARDGLKDRSVVIAVRAQVDAGLAMLELDGVVRRMIILPPDFSEDWLASVVLQGDVDAVVCDDLTSCSFALPKFPVSAPTRTVKSGCIRGTEWVLPTSGTSGRPKLVAHSLQGLAGAIGGPGAERPIWGTFYDIRRYGGLQIFLRAVIGGAPLVISDASESLSDQVARMAEIGVTHLSGTPSHWRKLLMSGEAFRISPRYVRLSGEIADRAILEALGDAYPQAKIVHAYASTEAGVGFEVTDGREGFPASYLDGVGSVEMRLVDGTLHLRSQRTASHYVGRSDLRLKDDSGFVDTDDLVEVIADRCYFRGRRAGTINVGGLKVSPEEVEQVINSHEGVRVSLVKARRSPITGDLIVADVVLKDEETEPSRRKVLKDEIASLCRERLERHKVPAMIEFVPTLAMTPAGKLLRREL